MHKQEDDAFRARREVRRLGREGIRGDAILRKQRSQAEQSEPGSGLAEQRSTGKQSPGVKHDFF